jgi:hypothetical protein
MDENTEDAFKRILGVTEVPEFIKNEYRRFKFCSDRIGGGQILPQIIALVAYNAGKEFIAFPEGFEDPKPGKKKKNKKTEKDLAPVEV